MLKITIPAIELYDEVNDEFITSKEQQLSLEHSLVSLSKWESKWCKPFLSKDEKTIEETVDYIRCMTMTQNVSDEIYSMLTLSPKLASVIRTIKEYIDAPMTATVIHDEQRTVNRSIITAEIIYYWMIALNIPFECQKWHLNRLLTLINVTNLRNTPQKKMSKKEIMSRNASLNAARRRALNSEG